ncbi:MAG: hypothetical protein ACTSRG_07270 [Candidatus Helarchaeota archaeon]
MSKSKDKLKKLDAKIEEEKQKEMARLQLEAARDIAMKGFSRFGIRDFFENKIVQTSLLAIFTFLGLFFGTAFLFYFTRNTDIIGLLFTDTMLFGLPNYIWWIIGGAVAVVIIVLVTKRKKSEI